MPEPALIGHDVAAEAFSYRASPRAPDVGAQLWTNRRTGESELVPNGIDPGWAHNTSLTDPAAEARTYLEGRLAGSPKALRRAVLRVLDGCARPDFG